MFWSIIYAYITVNFYWSELDTSSGKIFDPQDISAEYFSQFSKNFCLAKNGGHFEFSNFSQKLQNIKMLISRKPC